MKTLPTIATAKKELKNLQMFFNKNRESVTCGGTKYVDKNPLKSEDIEKIIEKLKEVAELYINTHQNSEYINTISSLSKYQNLQYLALKNGWEEIKSLDFDKQTFEKNAQFLLDKLNLNKKLNNPIGYYVFSEPENIPENELYTLGPCPFGCQGMLDLAKDAKSNIYIVCNEVGHTFKSMQDVKNKNCVRVDWKDGEYLKLDEALKTNFKEHICVFDNKNNKWKKLDGSKADF